MTRLKPNSPHGVPMQQTRREGYLDPEAEQDRDGIWGYIAAKPTCGCGNG
jgi:hypothetical protein